MEIPIRIVFAVVVILIVVVVIIAMDTQFGGKSMDMFRMLQDSFTQLFSGKPIELPKP